MEAFPDPDGPDRRVLRDLIDLGYAHRRLTDPLLTPSPPSLMAKRLGTRVSTVRRVLRRQQTRPGRPGLLNLYQQVIDQVRDLERRAAEAGLKFGELRREIARLAAGFRV
jgi:hypothetical protein